MAGLNVSKWQASRTKPFYTPVMQFYLRMIRTALDEACAVTKVPYPYSSGWLADGRPFDAGWLDQNGEQLSTYNRAHWQSWDDAIMARDWISRETPDRVEDPHGYLLSFEHACEVLGLDADHEATWMLRQIDEAADFDLDEVHARIEWLIKNPPDDVEEERFESFRCVPVLDQGSLFGESAA